MFYLKETLLQITGTGGHQFTCFLILAPNVRIHNLEEEEEEELFVFAGSVMLRPPILNYEKLRSFFCQHLKNNK